ncbi:MAG: CDGSH iron-sulfur domain-containing protein, partial [Gemmatimonadota bacterium]
PSVFDTSRKPWINPDGASADRIAAVVHRCPTGALQYERLDGAENETPEPENTLTVRENGPLFARGDIHLVDAEHRPVARIARAAFCRCGGSSNKPYCDGSHAEVGFEAPADPGDGRTTPRQDDRRAPLVVRLRPNGPLVLDGPFSIRAAGTEGSVEADGAALCRCGASSRKPFCDGSHKSIGFVSADPDGS